ncbi:MAG: beta strand repeat-containing protein, partial [Gammaproteobacteria bacterium]
MQVKFSSNDNQIANNSLVNNILQYFMYSNNSPNPPSVVTLAYKFDDGLGANNSITSLSTNVNINQINNAPVNIIPHGASSVPISQSDTVITNIIDGSKISIPISILLNNDSTKGIVADNLTINAVSVVSGGGTAVINGNYIDYTPAAAFNLTAGKSTNIGLSYTAVNDLGSSNANVNLMVINSPNLIGSGQNVIIGTGSITGTSGNDYLLAENNPNNPGSNMVTTNGGKDVILLRPNETSIVVNDFNLNCKFDISQFAINFNALNIQQINGNTVVTVNYGLHRTYTITLLGGSYDLTANNFIFSSNVMQNAVVENNSYVFSGSNNVIAISDVDANSGVEQIYLTTANGTLTLGSTNGISIVWGSNNSSAVIFRGTLTALNNALNGLIFTPNINYVGTATIQMTTDDLGNTGSGSGTNSSYINIQVVKGIDIPLISGMGTNALYSYTERSPLTLINNQVSISDPQADLFNAGAGDYSGITITICRQGTVSGNPQDLFGFGSMSNVIVSGNNLLYNQQSIGTFTNSGGQLSITFTSNNNVIATRALVNQVLDAISYANTSHLPPNSVNLAYTINDGLAVNTYNTTVNIIQVNDSPVQVLSHPSISAPIA